MSEIRDCEGFEGLYTVNSDGEVFNVATGKELSHSKSTNGYHVVKMRKNGKGHTKYVHRLVAIAFHGKGYLEGKQVAHNDGNKDNNCADNLRWDTSKGNIRDKRKHGTYLYGEKCHTTSITEDQAIAILNDERKYIDIAKDYGVSKSTVGAIKNGVAWKHLGGGEKRIGNNKITPDDVRAIRNDHSSNEDIATKYGITRQSVYKIKAMKSWKHVD